MKRKQKFVYRRLGCILTLMFVACHHTGHETIDAVQLISHYRENAYGANEAYRNKRISVTGKIKDIQTKSLSHQGFTNQFEITIMLYGELMPAVSDTPDKESKEQETEKQTLYRQAKNIREDYFTDEVRCSFHRRETYSLRHLKKNDTITIQGEVGDNGLRDFSFDELNEYYPFPSLLFWAYGDDIKEGLTYAERDDLGLTGKKLSLPLNDCTLVSTLRE